MDTQAPVESAPEDTTPAPQPPADSFLTRFREALGLKHLIIAAVVAIIVWLAVVPLFFLFSQAFVSDGELTTAAFARAYGQAIGLGELTKNTIIFAVFSTTLSVVLGITFAFITERTDIPGRTFVYLAALAPLVIPGVLYTVAWVMVASPRSGILNVWIAEPFLGAFRINVFSMEGMILVQGLDSVPLVFLIMMAAFRSMDPSLEEAGLISGASHRYIIRRITLPLVIPGILSAFVIILVKNLESFATPAILGLPANIWVFTSRIWGVLNSFPTDYGAAGALSVSLLVVAAIGVTWQSKISAQGANFATVTGKGLRPRRLEIGGRSKVMLLVLAIGYFIVAVAMPLTVLIYASIQPFYAAPTLEALGNSTFENYVEVFTRPQLFRSFKNSIWLATASGFGVVVLTAVAAWFVVKSRVRGRTLVDHLAFLPIIIPGLVLGVALLFTYLRSPIPVYGTLWILWLAYITKFMPYGMRYATVTMVQVSAELEEAAHSSGASWLQTFRRITLPLAAPGLIAAFLYVFAVSLRELSTSILIYSPGNEVLSITIFELWQNAQFPELSALGILMIVLVLVVGLAARAVSAKTGVKSEL